MRNLKLLALGMMALALHSCNKENTVIAGPQTNEDRLVPLYSSIEVDGSMDVVFTTDTSYLVRVSAPQNLIQHIKTEVSGNALKIYEDNNNVITRKDVTIYLSETAIDKIKLDGSGDISGTGLIANNFELELNGSGDIDLNVLANTVDVDLIGSGDIDITGSANSVVLELNGSGDIDARNLTTSDATVELDGSGDMSVRASNSLVIDLEGSGDVFYWGNPPTVNSSISGSGSVHNMN